MNLRNRPISRRGFSLLEVLCTLALTAILLAALAGAMSLYSSLLSHSATTIQNKSLALALFSRFSADARACILPRPESSSTTSVAALADLLDLTPNLAKPTSIRPGSCATTLEGDSESVRFLILPQEAECTADDCGPHWVAFGSARALARHFPAPSVDGRTGSGLERWSQNGRGKVSRQVLAGNVVEIRLRYWDGHSWHLAWTAAERRDLPAALEISLALSTEGVIERFTTVMSMATRSHDLTRHSQPATPLRESRP